LSQGFIDFANEARVMSQIPPCPYVIRLIGLVREPFCILTEFIDGGSLFEYLRKPDVPYDAFIAMCFLKQICFGIDHLHSNNIVHR